MQEIAPKGCSVADSLDSAADGRALLISSRVEGQLALLRVDLRGNASVLSRPGREETTVGIPSPDGKRVGVNFAKWGMTRK